jgi:hypothetical protein
MKPDYAQWTELAFQYGPFFFSLLFMIYLVGSRAKAYTRAASRQPPASKDELSTLKWLLNLSFAVGVVLVAVSVAWWLWYRPALYAFQGKLHNLRSYQHVASPGQVYFKPVYGDPAVSPDDQIRDEVFVATKRTPFRKGDSIHIEVWKGSGARTLLAIDFVKDDDPIFLIEWDEGAQKTMIKRAPGSAASLDWFPKAYAEDRLAEPAPDKALGATVTGATGASHGCVSAVAILQNPRSDVGAKIGALDALGTLSDPDLRMCARSRTASEPALITVLDLTHHSDPELASKARRVMNRMDLDGFVVAGLKSTSAESRKDAEAALLRLERAEAERLTSAAGVKLTPAVQTSLKSSKTARVPRATGSPQGDRYYVRARWDPGQPQVVECLSRLFNAELISTRTLEQEQSLMKSRRERVVYWYSPEWATMIASKIDGCGASADFVTY